MLTREGKSNCVGKDEDTMSFVGMAICDDGIVAFGDSKSSHIDVLGNYCEDSTRGNIKKVFLSKGYVLTTCHANTFFNQNNALVKIEDYITETIKEFDSYYDFMENLLCQLSANQENQYNLYKFMIGGKDKIGYFIQYIDIESFKHLYNGK